MINIDYDMFEQMLDDALSSEMPDEFKEFLLENLEGREPDLYFWNEQDDCYEVDWDAVWADFFERRSPKWQVLKDQEYIPGTECSVGGLVFVLIEVPEPP